MAFLNSFTVKPNKKDHVSSISVAFPLIGVSHENRMPFVHTALRRYAVIQGPDTLLQLIVDIKMTRATFPPFLLKPAAR